MTRGPARWRAPRPTGRVVHQLVPSYVPGDAVSDHAAAVHALLVELGCDAHLWAAARRRELRPRVPVRPWHDLAPAPGDVLLYHLSTGHRMADWVRERREVLVVDHHNVTPAAIVAEWEPGRAGELVAGRRQVGELAHRCALGLADSSFNRAELDAAGYGPTVVAPVLLDPAARAVAPHPGTAAALAGEADHGGRDWLFVGRVAPSKGQLDLVAAFAAHRRLHDPRARLHLVGGTASPPYRAAVEAAVAAAGLTGAVRLWGATSQAVLCALYAAADVFVSCSAHEGFGVPLLEAMWWGVPVVAVDAGAVAETLGGAGLVLGRPDPVLVAEAAARATTDDPLRRWLVARGQERAADFALDRTRATMAAALAPVLDGPRDRAVPRRRGTRPVPCCRAWGVGRPLHLALITPRYGADVRGGAEQGARGLAEHLVDLAGWRVEVFTSCARESTTWAAHYPAGTTTEGGVVVHRFAGTGRDPDFDRTSGPVLARPERASAADERRWFHAQGPVPDGLLAALAASDADLVAGYPYLYWPIVEGVLAQRDRAVLHPAAHDEPPLRLPRIAAAFAAARGVAYHSDAERRLVERRFPVAHKPAVVLGLGVDAAPTADAAAARATLALGDRPYLLCLGRVDDNKGTGFLARWFAALRDGGGPGGAPDLALVLAGPVADAPPAHRDVVVAGAVDDATKWGLLAGCTALVNPSAMESFSLVIMEAWACDRPVLVNGRCVVTVDHARASGGGLWFDGWGSFAAAVELLVADAGLRDRLGAAGRRYVEARYAWPAVVTAYERFASAVLGGAA